jgi:ABC-type Na+ efflux pump permease subunit
MKRSMLPATLVMPALLYLPFHHAVHAYIDPGTGSIILQTVIGGFAAVLVAIGMFWKQIKAFVGNLFSRSKKSEEHKEQ